MSRVIPAVLRALLVLPAILFVGYACQAQNLVDISSEWETRAVKRRGPQQAGGLLLHFERDEGSNSVKNPIALIFTEMARIAQWDVLRIKGRSGIEDKRILAFVEDQASKAREAGYRQIVVAGIRQGGWLALLAARLPGVDAAIALTPDIATEYGRPELERMRDMLAQKAIGAGAKRIAAFFFEGDLQDPVEERRAIVVQRALQETKSTFMVIDRPPDLQDSTTAESGRFVRRYRDCLLQFVQGADQSAGEVQCSVSSGYAVGADIDFPAYADLPKALPPGADPAFAPFWGRWEGDDAIGTYLILQTVDVRPKNIYFKIGFSDSPEIQPGATATSRMVDFQVDGSGRRLYHKLSTRHDMLTVTLRSATELEYEIQRSSAAPAFIQKSSIRLRKRSD